MLTQNRNVYTYANSENKRLWCFKFTMCSQWSGVKASLALFWLIDVCSKNTYNSWFPGWNVMATQLSNRYKWANIFPNLSSPGLRNRHSFTFPQYDRRTSIAFWNNVHISKHYFPTNSNSSTSAVPKPHQTANSIKTATNHSLSIQKPFQDRSTLLNHQSSNSLSSPINSGTCCLELKWYRMSRSTVLKLHQNDYKLRDKSA